MTPDDFHHLKSYVDARCAAIDLRITEVYQAIQRGVDKADVTMTTRLDAMNEFRAALSDMANRSATRDQLDLLRENVKKELATLDRQVVKDGKVMAQTAAVVALLVSIVIAGLAAYLQWGRVAIG
jgi:hypothetical protein